MTDGLYKQRKLFLKNKLTKIYDSPNVKSNSKVIISIIKSNSKVIISIYKALFDILIKKIINLALLTFSSVVQLAFPSFQKSSLS